MAHRRVHHLVRRCRGCLRQTAGRHSARLPGRRGAGRPAARAIRSPGSAPWPAELERLTYRDSRAAGALHTALLLVGRWVPGAAPARATVGGGGRDGDLGEPGRHLAGAHRPEDGRAARPRRHRRRRGRLLPSLCGRDPALLDRAGLTRAALESIAENTSDAQVAPLLWAAVGGSARGAGVPRRSTRSTR